MKLPELFPMKPVLNRAFNVNKARLKAMSKFGDDFVSKKEFIYLLQYIKNYYVYWAIFSTIDTSKDKQLSLK